MTAGLSADEEATLRYVASRGPLRNSERYIDDAASQVGISRAAMKQALAALVTAQLLVVQDAEEEADPLTGRRGRTFRITLSGQAAADS